MAEISELDVEPDLVQHAERRFVLVTGAGRSGTSTVAGALNYLGLHLPRPVLGTNRSNPRGFFESTWAIDFHKRIMTRANIDTVDARPEAIDSIRSVLRPEHREEIEEFLRAESAHAPQVVVKDPRSTWMPWLWAGAADAVGLTIGYVTMLRHPAEVIGSRSTYYAKGDEEQVRRFQVMSVARWVNANLISERETRRRSRVLVRYDDLLADWRATLSVLGKDLALTFNTDIDSGRAHVVDEFIDPSLRRHEVRWADLRVPGDLQEVAEETWQSCGLLADRHGVDESAQRRLDDLSGRYEQVFRDAAAISHDLLAAEVKTARRKAARRARAGGNRPSGQADPAQLPRATATARVGRLLSRGVRRVRSYVRMPPNK